MGTARNSFDSSLGLLAVCFLFLSSGPSHAALDTDLDGVDDSLDNCIETPNNQLDADLDGYGNACDGDFNNDGATNGSDFIIFRGGFNTSLGDPEYLPVLDMDANEMTNGADFILFRGNFSLGLPGPSGVVP